MTFNVREKSETCAFMKLGSGPVIPILIKMNIRDFLYSYHKNPNQLNKLEKNNDRYYDS